MPKIDRMRNWNHFNEQMLKHIPQYTEEQYGNKEGNEQVDEFTPEQCWQNMQRCYNRRNSNTRGNKEKLRDLIKVAHHAEIVYHKLLTELQESDVY